MESKELRIGNFVTLDNLMYHPKETGEIVMITDVESDGCGLVVFKDLPYAVVFAQFTKYLKPIPLDEEWLIKLGFRENNKFYCMDVNDVMYLSWNREIGFNIVIKEMKHEEFSSFRPNEYHSSLKIEYVHQLQNLAFALGHELTIKKEENA